jgi:thiol-disulfide isomerase/thioredoxin
LSKPTETLISAMMAAGPAAKRPPHMVFEPASAAAPFDRLGSLGVLEAMTTDPSEAGSPRTAIYLVAALIAAIAGFGAVYVSLAPPVHEETPGEVSTAPATSVPSTTPEAGSGLEAYATGKMVTFVAKAAPEAVPEIAFEDATGKSRSLAEWRGKVVLLNVWATWCAPCRHEMPSLDRLQQAMGGADFDVVALSTDRDGVAKAKVFLDEIKVRDLEPLADPTSKSNARLRIIGMPTTLLIDRQGREVGRLTGPAEWDSDDAKRLIEAVIKDAS